ncbi:MAG TPA: peptidylprolyl isomerase [Candidatus Sabulitectum sp.]|nr:peptidylprolyl isomerase [Candidatus Sabulitectum sp.]HPJ28054.1 peptidylprolyl isomerase [Candidatus Sabulitectum sp.]HPR21240.1 peptidylprolyl isomerase [Candidatus Sabulitectum sp.]HRW77209.1 peptidylprolyl isomerase [Candidatus Sabulitectum sp.]
MEIRNNRVASFHYTLKNPEGEVISASPEDDPLTYIHGTGSIIPGLERELEGKSQGDSFSVVVPPEEGYGQRNPNLVAVLKREVFHGMDKLEPGMQFQAQDSNGNLQVITVSEVNGDEVTVDRNHPLAGMPLDFTVNVVDVREQTEEEAQGAEDVPR